MHRTPPPAWPLDNLGAHSKIPWRQNIDLIKIDKEIGSLVTELLMNDWELLYLLS